MKVKNAVNKLSFGLITLLVLINVFNCGKTSAKAVKASVPVSTESAELIFNVLDSFKNDLCVTSKYNFRAFLNGMLAIDSAAFKGSEVKSFGNYAVNKRNDISGVVLNDQNAFSVSKLRLGSYRLSYNGCEVIAVYNAAVMSGVEVSVAEVIELAEKNCAMVLYPLVNGYLGTNPFAIGRLIEELGLGYSLITPNELLQEGVYVVSFWQGLGFDAMIHTVAIKVSQEGGAIVLNGSYDPKEDKALFIRGYKLG